MVRRTMIIYYTSKFALRILTDSVETVYEFINFYEDGSPVRSSTGQILPPVSIQKIEYVANECIRNFTESDMVRLVTKSGKHLYPVPN